MRVCVRVCACVCVLSVCSIHWSLHMVQEYAANHTLKFNEKFANFEQHRAPECGAIWILLCTWIDNNLWTELVSNYTLDLILMNSYVKNKHYTKITSQMMNSEKPNNIRWLVESLLNIPFHLKLSHCGAYAFLGTKSTSMYTELPAAGSGEKSCSTSI